jgi:replicative DNA helicase
VLDTIDRTEKVVPTGMASIDNMLFGGTTRGTLNVIITPPNKGKSTFLINIGKYAALSGFKVVHYTFELSEDVINRRYFMSMVRMSKAELKSMKRTAFDRISRIAEKVASDSIIVKEYPAYCTTAATIRSHLHSVKNTRGFFPDLLIFDYADLMQSEERYKERRHELSSIYYGLRNLAKEFDAVSWTATQTNRTGNQGELITINDLAECFEKAAASDVMLSINQSLDDRRMHVPIARVFFAKSRDDASNESVEVLTDWQRSWIGDRT